MNSLRASSLCTLVLTLCLTASAQAGSYTVSTCGDIPNFAWRLDATPGHQAEALCPSGNSDYRGITTRITQPVAAGTYERAFFDAPPGTTITGFRWAGRANRESCVWSTEIRAQPADQTILGNRAGRNCGTSGFNLPSLDFPVPAGTTQLFQNVQCGAGQCPAGATMHTFAAAITISDHTLPNGVVKGGGLAGGRWVAGEQHLLYDLNDNTGVRRAELLIGSAPARARDYACSYALPAPCSNRSDSLSSDTDRLADGPHVAGLAYTDAAGNTGALERTFKSDNTPPDAIEPAVEGGEGWRRDNGYTIRWHTPAQEFAPIVAARYRLCDPDGVTCEESRREGPDLRELASLPVRSLGDSTLQVWLEDEAGNETSLGAEQLHLRLDPQKPDLAFLPQDPSDPLTVAVRATDSLSGVASGEIEMRGRGGTTWHSLATRVTGDRLTADIDDERFRRGLYEFRARATDHAGNESSTGTRTDGAQAAVRLPVRVTTRLKAGFAKIKVVRRTVRRGGKRRVVRRRIRVLKRRARLGYRRKTRVRGVLTNPDGQPVDGAQVTVLTRRDLPGSDFRTAAFVRTDTEGRFEYTVRGTTSRVLRFRYDGSRRIRGSAREVKVAVPASGSIRTDRRRLLNGQAVTFIGRVRTKPIPPPGKLVEIQAYFRGRWRTISTTRTNQRGRWRFKYRFGATSGVVRYRFRALLSREGGYPFAAGTTPVVVVTVRGL